MTIQRTLLTAALGPQRMAALDRWREERALAKRHQAGVQKIATLAAAAPHKLHLGCGHVYKAGWINIDSYHIPPCTPDVLLDLRHGIPFPDASCSEVYSEHFFEHIPYPESAEANLQESLRVLQPGGRLSIGVPDPRPILHAYLTDTEAAYYRYFRTDPVVKRHLQTPMEAVNWLFRQGGEHHFIYDFETLAALLKRNGFVDIVQRAWDETRDSPARRGETIYVECRKPARP